MARIHHGALAVAATAVVMATVAPAAARGPQPEPPPVAPPDIARSSAQVAPGAPPTLAGCPMLPADNIWNTRIDNLPADATATSRYVTKIGSTAGMHPDFGKGLWNGGPIGIPYVTVPNSQPAVNISFYYGGESDGGAYRIPANAPIEGGPNSTGDRHVLVVDRDNCMLAETFDTHPPVAPSTMWNAGSGAIFNLNRNDLRTDTWTSADAAGLPILPGLVRYDEVAAGAINHALRFTAPQTNGYIWPARHQAPTGTGTDRPPMGLRVRLKASFNISSYSAENQVILQALKTYGMMLADNGSPWYLSGVPDERWDNNDLHQLQTGVHGSDFEVVDVSSLRISANSGQALQQGSPTPPSAPAPSAGSVTTSSVTVNWPDVATESSYQVAWSLNPASSSSYQFATLAANAIAYTVTGLAANTAVWVWVRACNAAGCSVWAGGLQLRSGGSGPPSTPANLRISYPARGTVAAAWDSVAGITHYWLAWSVDGGATWSFTQVPAGTTSATRSGLGTGQLIYFAVSACNNAACSPFSGAVLGVATRPLGPQGQTSPALPTPLTTPTPPPTSQGTAAGSSTPAPGRSR